MSPALIEDEFQNRPLTENSRWRESEFKETQVAQARNEFVNAANRSDRLVATPSQCGCANCHHNVLNSHADFLCATHGDRNGRRRACRAIVAVMHRSVRANCRPRSFHPDKLLLNRIFF
jgi:hypothetical protein